MNMIEKVSAPVFDNINMTQETLAKLDLKPINKAVKILEKARENGNTVFTFGNGGSHSNASHFANDLLKACHIKAICISDMIPTVLAYMNDEAPNVMFYEPIMKFRTIDDILIGFSCSGNSPNVGLGLTHLNYSILFTGYDGGMAKEKADIIIKVPNPNIRIQESCHSVICHAIIEALLDE